MKRVLMTLLLCAGFTAEAGAQCTGYDPGIGGQGGTMPFCDGETQEFEAMGASESVPIEEPTSWEQFLIWLDKFFTKEIAKPAMVIGDVGRLITTEADRLGSMDLRSGNIQYSGGQCSATVIGPYTAITAAHCFNTHTDGNNIAILKKLDEADSALHFYRVSHKTEDPDWDLTSNAEYDFALLHFAEKLPTPYIGYYDSDTDSANCTSTIVHGYGSGTSHAFAETDQIFVSSDAPLGEAPFFVMGRPLRGRLYGDVNDAVPDNSGIQNGDSGGALYAIVNGVPQIAGIIALIYNIGYPTTCKALYLPDLSLNSTWLTTNHDRTLLTMDYGIELKAIGVHTAETGESITLDTSPGTIYCDIRLNATANPIAYAGCVLAKETGESRSCATSFVGDDGVWTCAVDFPQGWGNPLGGSGTKLRVQRVFASDTSGNTTERDFDDLVTAEAEGILAIPITNGSGDGIPPTILSQTVTQDPDPGDTMTCTVTVNVFDNPESISCTFESVSYSDNMICAANNISGGVTTCSFVLPGDVPSSSVWTVTKITVRDDAYNITTGAGDQGFTVAP